MTVYVVCEHGHEDGGTIQAIHLVTTSLTEAEAMVAHDQYGRYIESYEVTVSEAA